MIRQIVRKDWQLLWPFVAGLTVLNAIVAWMSHGWYVFGVDRGFAALGPPAVIGWALLVAVLVQQDAVPGTRQDWLTRPIRRPDLAAAKLIFVVVLLHVPLFVMSTVDVLAAGYFWPEAIGAAAMQNALLLIIVTLTPFAFAAATRSVTEIAVAAIVAAFASQAAIIVFETFTADSCGATCGSGLEWLSVSARLAVMACAALFVIALQYSTRGATGWARAALLGGTVAVVASGYLPWTAAFAIQRIVTGRPAAPADIVILLDRAPRSTSAAAPAGERIALSVARGSLAGLEPGAELRAPTRLASEGMRVSLPLRIDGQRAGTVLWADRVQVRLLADDGRVVYRGRGDELEVRAGAQVSQTVFIPSYVFAAHAGGALRAELDYWLTSLEENAATTLRMSEGVVRVPSGEQCAATPLRAGDGAHVRCFSIRQLPPCYSVGFENGPARDLLVCRPSYAPSAFSGTLYRRFDVDVPADPDKRLGQSVLRLATYAPREHFTAQLVVPELRLADWVAEPLPSSAVGDSR